MDTPQRRKEPQQRVQSQKEVKAVLSAYRVFETSVDGKAVLQDLCDSYMDRTSFVQRDSHMTAFQEGQRSVVLAIFEILDELKQQ